MTLRLRPVTITDAKAFVAKHHRHNRPDKSALFAVGCEAEGRIVGVATVGRPKARAFDDGWTCEITRLCTDGTPNACSLLYGAAARAAKALGYASVVTYTLAEESGASLRAAGFEREAELKPRPTWSCPSRPRVQTDLFGNETRPAGAKVRWRRKLAAGRDVAPTLPPCPGPPA